jgi:sodium transport system ATP-binding protein
MIKLEKLRKSFSGRPVLRDLSFEAQDGEITGLLGVNGAGKTTTLRTICGVLQPESGSITIDDETGETGSPHRQQSVGALLDHIGLYARLTVRENLEYFGRLRGMNGQTLSRSIDRVISVLGLEAIADRPTAGFSQGERMKTALGRAILHSPKNLLLDEPTNGLDILTIRALRELLKRLRAEGTCVIFSSHVLEEVRALCDTVVVISEGRIAGQGSATDLCSQTSTACLEDAFVQLTSAREVQI